MKASGVAMFAKVLESNTIRTAIITPDNGRKDK